jgi:hypothetical protein
MISFRAFRVLMVVIVIESAIGFIPNCEFGLSKELSLQLSANNDNTESNNHSKVPTSSRRGFMSATAAFTSAALISHTNVPNVHAAYVLGKKDSFDNTVVGREIASFNDLIYNFKNSALDGGLDASTLKEPSVPFVEFGDRMRKGEVAFVEFYAPSGQVAYVTFKKGGGKKLLSNNNKAAGNSKNVNVPTEPPIRIGQG